MPDMQSFKDLRQMASSKMEGLLQNPDASLGEKALLLQLEAANEAHQIALERSERWEQEAAERRQADLEYTYRRDVQAEARETEALELTRRSLVVAQQNVRLKCLEMAVHGGTTNSVKETIDVAEWFRAYVEGE